MLGPGNLRQSDLSLENEIVTKITQFEARQPLLHAAKCYANDLDDAANLLCGKALEEILCLAWLKHHKTVLSDLISGKVTRLKEICNGKTCDSQPCKLDQKATLDPFIRWAVERKLLQGSDITEAEYIRDKRNDHGHAYAARLFGKTGVVAPPLGSDPDTLGTIRRTIQLVSGINSSM